MNASWEERASRIAFRPLTHDDLPTMVRWLSDPDVRCWYDSGELTVTNMEHNYGPRIDGVDSTLSFITIIDGHDAGYIQTYLIADYPDYARQVDVAPGAAGVDLFLGEAAYRNAGWGAPVLRAFLREIIFARLGATSCVIGPDPANRRAIRAYEKAGFRYLKIVHVITDGEEEDEYVMTITPDELPGGARFTRETSKGAGNERSGSVG